MKSAMIAIALLAGAPALANSLVPPGPRAAIAKSSMSATPADEWNKLTRNEGKNTEIWTIDGDGLNKVTFLGGIAPGMPIMREVDRKNRPLPKVTANMLITDIPALLESTYRVRYGVNRMSIDSQEPATISGQKGIRFTYSFTRDDEVSRKGEAIGAVIGGKLYLVAYEAPALYFFDKDVEKYRRVAETLKF
ncbi:hypothetical protein [Sphingomonas sp.]|uniref:hypothetical protein n=1 Tax=Sphingomonas sp. TaxID=28214 RepID=UPI002615E4AB|nr:hypothetical protein [Sphingomonas sp.]MDK2766776.1 hypothetical protein [Sphingomonas sp.]